MSGDAYCAKCGRPRQQALICGCGLRFDDQQVTIESGKILARSPLALPARCVKCGRDESNGVKVNKTLYGYSSWIVLTVFLGLLPLILVYYLTRQALHISYSLCPQCTKSRKTKLLVAWGAWTVAVALLLVAVWVGSGALGIVVALLFVGAMVASGLAVAPLRVVGLKDGAFIIKGAGEEFLKMAQGPARL